MRRCATAILLWSLVVGTASIVAQPASAQDASAADGSAPADLPPGFTDGLPVGGTELPGADLPAPAPSGADGTSSGSSAPLGPAGAETSASSTRYFGQGPWDAILAAGEDTSRCSALSAPTLSALVIAPIFKESSAATTASSAPSPMTLSRWDEWNGTYATTSNHSANYGLYAFRDPYTAYTRAYWHPGIGIWQYDGAGVGAPFTAIERMDVRVVAGDVAAGMASRYCNPPTSVVGHDAPFTNQERRDAAWWPWWAGSTTRSCPLCQAEYDRMTASTPYFANVITVPGISTTGGAVKRTCTEGSATQIDCWYIDPRVGVIEGATGWATYATDGQGSPTIAPTPLSLPFYVVKRNGAEERHWLREDTGYDIDISGTRLLGKNERPRSNQTGSGVTWSSSSQLCDIATAHGTCSSTPPPPPPTTTSPPPTSPTTTSPPPTSPPPTSPPSTPDSTAVPAPAGSGLNSIAQSIGGTYRTIAFDADGNGRDDILWYAPGAGSDYLWLSDQGDTFTSVRVTINGTYGLSPLDANGDGKEDLLFYAPATGTTYLWTSNGDGTFSSTRLLVGAGRQPLVYDVDHNGRDDIFWYGPGSIADALWISTGSGWSISPQSVGGFYQPLIGDFDGNAVDDIYWYRPGAGADYLWLTNGAGGHTDLYKPVAGTYRPAIGNFDGLGGDDIAWYAPGTASDTMWFATGAGSFTSQPMVLNDTYDPVVADLGADGRDDIIWHAADGSGDLWTRWSSSRARTSMGISLTGPQIPIVGSFGSGGSDGILWYAAGATGDALWIR